MKALRILTGVLVVAGITACDRVDMKNDKAQYSYAIGYQVAKNMKSQGVEIDAKAFSAAVNDVMGGKEPKLDEKSMRDAMRKMAESRREKDTKEAEANLKKSEEFLTANKTKEGVKTTESGLQYKVITEGKGKTPKDTSVVEVHYKGTLIDGTEFDSSYKRNSPAQFPVKGVIPGWTEALKLMKEGSKYELYIPPQLA